ncbi:acrB/AcrD/AcrF family protein, partial [Vibrio parahaemolyticus V-223/04]
VLLTY